jgi:mRNA-degrading endonuclease RelE of RelBE toxin-antitoxin system
MAFKITITEDADRQLRSLPAREQRIVETAIQSRLEHQPATPTRAIKKLRPNPFAEFELRAGNLRVLYNVDEGGGPRCDLREFGNSITHDAFQTAAVAIRTGEPAMAYGMARCDHLDRENVLDAWRPLTSEPSDDR